MSDRFDDVLLEDFMRTFYGFGRHAAPYWLIGMEEGGHKTFGEIEAKLNSWRDAGRPALMTLTRQRTKIQRTWGGLIRVVLAARGEGVPNRERVLEYQNRELGKSHGETCLMELLPLPSPSTREWLYADYSTLPYLMNRATYRKEVTEWRVEGLRALIQAHRPQAVVFYRAMYKPVWRRIAGINFEPNDRFDIGLANGTVFVRMDTPVYTSKETLAAIGQAISRRGAVR